MKVIVSIILFIAIILFSGCSSKNINQDNSKIENTKEHTEEATSQESSEEDEFLDEFEEEMQIEEKSDPLSGYNRVMTNFNDGMYEY
ncbi:MAG: hypothetical protein DRG78_12040, partial [Epsilonproteobacteria bacterium]